MKQIRELTRNKMELKKRISKQPQHLKETNKLIEEELMKTTMVNL